MEKAMKLTRIKAVVLHSWYHLNHAMETWIDLFWFSTLQVVVFGFMTQYLQGSSQGSEGNFVILGLLLWNIIYIGEYSIAVGALWEIWSRSFSSLFVTPLTLSEFVFGNMIAGIFKSLLVLVITALMSMLIFDFSILSLGYLLIIIYLELIVFSWTAGMFILSLILRFGTNIQSLAWGLIFILQPIGAVFYPVDALPESIRWISFIFPTTYIFEVARDYLQFNNINWNYIFSASILNIIFFVLSYFVMEKMHSRGKKTGAFARMDT